MSKKVIALMMAMILLLGAAVGGTIAWLTAQTNKVVNTFTVGNIDIDLEEKDPDEFKLVPGAEIKKDPIVTVKANSEDCYVFVQVTKSTNLDKFVSYEIVTTGDRAWKQLTDKDGKNIDGVYYQEVANSATNVELHVLVDDKVTVKEDVSKNDLDSLYKYVKDSEGKDVRTNELDPNKQPFLAFQAFAVQKDGFATADLAWAEVNKNVTP